MIEFLWEGIKCITVMTIGFGFLGFILAATLGNE